MRSDGRFDCVCVFAETNVARRGRCCRRSSAIAHAASAEKTIRRARGGGSALRSWNKGGTRMLKKRALAIGLLAVFAMPSQRQAKTFYGYRMAGRPIRV